MFSWMTTIYFTTMITFSLVLSLSLSQWKPSKMLPNIRFFPLMKKLLTLVVFIVVFFINLGCSRRSCGSNSGRRCGRDSDMFRVHFHCFVFLLDLWSNPINFSSSH
ncbi:hypothetical protein AAHE18_05G144500 [Arachis hypogaea]